MGVTSGEHSKLVTSGGGGPTKMNLPMAFPSSLLPTKLNNFSGHSPSANTAASLGSFGYSSNPSATTVASSTNTHEMDMLTLMRAKANLANMEATFQAREQQAAMFSGADLGGGGGGGKRSFSDIQKQRAAQQDDDSTDGAPDGGKRQKKGKKPSDLPRRALSAYNIFFSEQRKLILSEIQAKEQGGDEIQGAAADFSEETAKYAPAKEGEKPSVLNRTFFPQRTKRAHRKVHGKIGLVDLARQVSKRWKDLPDDKRKYYQDLAGEDKKRHAQALLDYQHRKAAESMIAIGGNNEEEERSNNATSLRDAIVEQYQQKLLAEMMGFPPRMGNNMVNNSMMSAGRPSNMLTYEQMVQQEMAQQHMQQQMAQREAQRRLQQRGFGRLQQDSLFGMF